MTVSADTKKRSAALFAQIMLTLSLSAALSTPVFADSVEGDREREALTRLAAEIAQLKPLIDDAQKLAPADERIRFRYDTLRADLERIRAGIEEHVRAPRVIPRAVTPLAGDYRP